MAYFSPYSFFKVPDIAGIKTCLSPGVVFGFQKLGIYIKAKRFNDDILDLIKEVNERPFIRNQLSRAAFSIPLNIAEGSGRFSAADRRNFFVIARGSVFECVSILDILHDRNKISNERFQILIQAGDELSRILYRMIKNLETNKRVSWK